MRLATWNVNSLGARLERVEAWLAEVEPDVLCLQETKLADDAFPALTFSALGYESVHHGQGRWNGVAILSRVGLDAPAVGFAPGDVILRDEARIVSATCGGVRVASVYVPNGRSPDHEQYAFKLEWLARAARRTSTTPANRRPTSSCAATSTSPPTTATSTTRRRSSARPTSRPPSAPRSQQLLDWGLVDVFRAAPRRATGCTRGGTTAPATSTRTAGCASTSCSPREALAERAPWSLVDRNARKGKPTPSDHAPVVVEFA